MGSLWYSMVSSKTRTSSNSQQLLFDFDFEVTPAGRRFGRAGFDTTADVMTAAAGVAASGVVESVTSTATGVTEVTAVRNGGGNSNGGPCGGGGRNSRSKLFTFCHGMHTIDTARDVSKSAAMAVASATEVAASGVAASVTSTATAVAASSNGGGGGNGLWCAHDRHGKGRQQQRR